MLDIKKLSRRIYREYRKQSSRLFFHNWEHTQVVRRWAVKLAKAMNADVELIETAAIFHDTGYVLNPNSTQHEEDSVEFLRDLSKNENYAFLRDRVDELEKCILATKVGASPSWREAKIVKDADLFQFCLVNYPKKVFELHFEISANKKVPNLNLRNFVKDTPKAMTMWIPYDEKTGDVGLCTDVGKEWASEGFIRLYKLYTHGFAEIIADTTPNKFENLYIMFLMALDSGYTRSLHSIVPDDGILSILEKTYANFK